MTSNIASSTSICLALIATSTLAVAASPESTPAASMSPSAIAATAGASAVQQLQAYSNTAYIPTGADISSIRFESVKTVKVASQRTSSWDAGFCASLQEPGGSMYCPYTRDGALVPAYRVTYSYRGQALSSDESGNDRFTFHVDLNPQGLSPTVRERLSSGKLNRSDAAGYFRLATNHGSTQETAIDEGNSSFCAGNYIDGAWTHTDRTCQDKVSYKNVATASNYVTVTVSPATAEFVAYGAPRR